MKLIVEVYYGVNKIDAYQIDTKDIKGHPKVILLRIERQAPNKQCPCYNSPQVLLSH